MSSAPSGRYQSRLFNFVARQSRKFKQQCDRAFHQLQNTTGWAVAVGLSPLLSIFQLNRSSARQMHQAVEQFPQLSTVNCDRQPEIPPDVDTPIQQVLLLVNVPRQERDRRQKDLGKISHPKSKILTLATCHSSLTTQSIRAIATQLSSRALVLVTAQNEILDILTAGQQQQLQQQIVAAIADYWRYQRLAYLRGQEEQGRQKKQGFRRSRNGDKEDLGDYQSPTTSTDVAVLRLYQLPTTNDQSKIQNLKSKIYLPLGTDSVLAILDRAVAEVESSKLIHLSAVAKSALSLAQSVSQSSLQVVEQLKNQLNVSMSRGTPVMASPGDSEASTNRIQTLIWAAIDYFFGGSAKPHLEQSASNSHLGQSSSTGNLAGIPDLPLKKTLKSGRAASPVKQLIGKRPAAKLSPTRVISAQLPPAPLVDTNIENSWLTLDDLFGESAIASGTTTGQHSKPPSTIWISPRDKKPSLVPRNESVRHSLSNFARSIQKFWSQPKPGSGLSQRKAVQGKMVETNNRQQVASLSQSSRPNQASEICDRTGNQSTQMESQSDWIETHATVMGYVKHPLEQLLIWLDQAMLWLEDLCIKIWRWLGQLVVKRL